MANLSEDIQCAGSDTRPPMLDRTDFASWQQRIRLHCQGKENRVNILKSIDKGPFQLGMFRETLAEGDEGALYLGPERPRVYSDLSPKEKERYKANIRATNILLQGLPKDIYTLINHYTDAKDIWDNVKMLLEGLRDSNYDQLYAYLKQHEAHANANKMMNQATVQEGRVVVQNVQGRLNRGQGNNARGTGASGNKGAQNRVGNTNPGQARQIKCYNYNGGQENVDDDVDEQPAPTTHTMFMANLSFADPVYDEADLSYDLDILFEVHDHDIYQDVVCELHGVHEMHDHVQPNCVVDSNAKYTSDTNMIPYDQYVKDNTESVVQNTVSSVPHDAPLMIINEMHELTAHKLMVVEVTSLKKDFKQKENKYLEEFLDMKALKEMVEDRLIKQDQSLQTVHMLCKRKPHYDEQRKIVIGYKNPLYLSKAKQVQSALYSGQEIVKFNHAHVLVHDSEDTLKIAETTRKKMNKKMKDPLCVKKKVKIASHDYSKENYLATFTPQKKFTPKQIFWSKDILKMKAEALKEQTPALRPIKALTVEVHLDYLKHLKESVATLREIIEEARTKTNVPVLPSIGVNICTDASGSKPRRNTKKNRISLAKRVNKKKVEEHHRTNKSSLNCCSKHMTGDRSRLRKFVKKFIGTVRLRNDHFGAIMGYGDYVIGDGVISRVYYVEGLGHNLFSVRKFCDSDLEVAFMKHSCYVRDKDGFELIKDSCGSNLYTISVKDMLKSSPICLLSKASKNKSWIWHRCLNHLNFGTINDLARKDLVRGLPRLKFEKYHLCSTCQLGKSKKHTHKPKAENTNLEVLNTLHMDFYGPMRLQTINRKKYILVIVDDYSRFTWVNFFRSKDETTEFVIKFLKQIPVGLNITNGVVKKQNRTIVEAARTMLIFSKALMFLWAEAVGTTCYTQNQSLIHTHHNKTLYELVYNKKPDLTFLHVFGALCYPINDSEDLGKL
uniref:Retrovirus-related Pol polyprotein from transposon TNT 1-94 n=1 Tax=Tanacetum cinerariifolium TaxID=118510 RepID=A0A699H4K1_TANCI|nr:retrovirus-related Pol polyprotein from transposon TNT 1-94 [Tanacetum cinerariifolium]